MRTIAILFTAAAVPALLASAPALKPGQYEIVAAISMSGQGQKMMPKQVHCYTAEELGNIARLVGGRTSEPNCKVLSSNLAGSTLTFTTQCPNGDGGLLTSTGEVKFLSQESYHAVVTMKSSGRGDNPITNGSTITIDGKRIGDCPNK